MGAPLPRAVLHGPARRGRVQRRISFFGLGEMLVFMAILVVALAYVWRKKADRMGVSYDGLLELRDDASSTTAVNWARKFSLFQYPFVTACCGMEFMSVAGPKYDIARFGAEFPRFSPRQADLLMIVGTITERQGPVLRAHLRADVPSPSG